MRQVVHFKEAALKAAIVLVPSYGAAYLTGEMVWVVPTLAASSFFAATIGVTDASLRNRVDENEGDTESEEGGPNEFEIDG
jgi:hypothetical protein